MNYAPLAMDEVPEFPDLKRADPDYGTCPRCIQAKRLSKSGLLPEHNTGMLPYLGGGGKASFRCSGSHARYAEWGNYGKYWDHHRGDWVEFPVEVPVLVRDDPKLEGVELPAWRLVEVPPSISARLVVQKLGRGERWRIELDNSAEYVNGALVRIADGKPKIESREALDGVTRVVSVLMAHIQIIESEEVNA